VWLGIGNLFTMPRHEGRPLIMEDPCHCEARSAEGISRLTSVPGLVRREIASALRASQ
jgi:hypothetical protein